MAQHKHHDLIIAWAKGAKIQAKNTATDTWTDTATPNWLDFVVYRIKHEPRPDVQQEVLDTIWNPVTGKCEQHSLMFTYDGETGRPKSVQVN